MFAFLAEFFEEHPILGTIGALIGLGGVHKAITGQGFGTTTLTETLMPGESASGSIATGSNLDFELALQTAASVTSSDPTVLQVTQGTGAIVAAKALKPGSAILTVTFSTDPSLGVGTTPSPATYAATVT
jgi:hypothetical protein